MARTEITDYGFPQGWSDAATPPERAREYCDRLEGGQVLCFSAIPFDFPAEDREFLLAQRQSNFKGHKNVSYRPKTDVLRGGATDSPGQTQKLHEVIRRFSQRTTDFLGKFLIPYAGKWAMDFASFRPLQEKGRDLSLHKRNDLMHVDAFPSRPTNGGRILRVFTNINPSDHRVWEVTDPFAVIAKKYARDAGLPQYARGAKSAGRSFLRGIAPVLRTVGVANNVDRSPYDKFMLRFHDYLKENTEYQQQYPKTRLEFPPGSTWLVYTDTVPHSVLSGQFALEQTYIVPLSAMVTPQSAPLRVLESMCGASLANA